MRRTYKIISAVIGLMVVSGALGGDEQIACALTKIENSVAVLLDLQLEQEAIIVAKKARVKALLKEIELAFAGRDIYQAEIDRYKAIRNSSPAIVHFREQLQDFDRQVPDEEEDELLELQ